MVVGTNTRPPAMVTPTAADRRGITQTRWPSDVRKASTPAGWSESWFGWEDTNTRPRPRSTAGVPPNPAVVASQRMAPVPAEIAYSVSPQESSMYTLRPAVTGVFWTKHCDTCQRRWSPPTVAGESAVSSGLVPVCPGPWRSIGQSPAAARACPAKPASSSTAVITNTRVVRMAAPFDLASLALPTAVVNARPLSRRPRPPPGRAGLARTREARRGTASRTR